MASSKTGSDCADRLPVARPSKNASSGSGGRASRRSPPTGTATPQRTNARSQSPGNRSTATATADGDASTGTALAPDGVFTGLLERIDSLKEEITAAITGEINPALAEIEDGDLRETVALLRSEADKLINQARQKQYVRLALDDLFNVVINLTPKAQKIEAVDLEIHRWTTDRRSKRYFDKNLLALQNGAKINRVYVISPRVTKEMMPDIERTLIRHLSRNSEDEVKDNEGQLTIAVIYHEDLPDQNELRDFAIFDDTKVLVEDFGSNWTSKYSGQLSTNQVYVKENHNYFNELWEAAKQLDTADDVKKWAKDTSERMSREGFKEDLFLVYCSDAKTTASQIKEFIKESGYTVRDWKRFYTGPALLKEIDNACRECQLGLFLFTGDELVPGRPPAPRDNVVFECGYFMSRKGEERVVGIWEDEVKQPTDLKGNIWVHLKDRGDISTIHTQLLDWLKKQLGEPAAAAH
jgi:predicted nucleotide-binding protein